MSQSRGPPGGRPSCRSPALAPGGILGLKPKRHGRITVSGAQLPGVRRACSQTTMFEVFSGMYGPALAAGSGAVSADTETQTNKTRN
jgi:hypothetical protein